MVNGFVKGVVFGQLLWYSRPVSIANGRKAQCVMCIAICQELYFFLIDFHSFRTVLIRIKQINPTNSPMINSRITEGNEGNIW